MRDNPINPSNIMINIMVVTAYGWLFAASTLLGI